MESSLEDVISGDPVSGDPISRDTVEDAASSVRAAVLCSSATLALRSGTADLSLQLASEAMDHAVKARDLAMIGRSLRIRGEAHLQAEAEVDSQASFQAALSYLPTPNWQDRFTVFLGLARLSLRQTHLTTAQELAAQAEAIHRTHRGLPWWHLAELQADLAALRKDWQDAAEGYRNVRRAYADCQQYRPAARIYLREARAWLSLDNTPELLATAASSMALLRPLRRCKALHRILMELTRQSLAGELTVVWLGEAEGWLEAEG